MNDPKKTQLFRNMLSAVMHILAVGECLDEPFEVYEDAHREEYEVDGFVCNAADGFTEVALGLWNAPGHSSVIYHVAGGGEAIIGHILAVFDPKGEVVVLGACCA